MKVKNILCKLIIYLLILNLLPVGFLSQSVKADEMRNQYEQYNRSSTRINNKYDIEGKIINVKQFENAAVVLTKNGLYSIKNGKSSKIELSDVSYVSHIKMKDNEIYLTPYLDNYSYPQVYCMLRINTENNFTKKEKLHGEDITFDYYNQLVEAYADFEGKSWFSIFDFDNNEYRLLRLDQNGNSKEMDKLNYKDYVHYDDAYTDMKVDKSNNLWFKVTENKDYGSSVLYKLGRINESGKTSFTEFKDGILNYCIDNDGDLWVIEGESKILHLDEKGNVIKKFEIKGLKDITVDEDGNIWIIQNNTIKMLKNDSFEVKYNISEDMTQLSVLNEQKMIAAGTKGICLIDGGKIDNIPVYSNVNDCAYVVSDDKGNIRVLSIQEEGYGEWFIDKKFKDQDITVASIDGQGNFKTEILKGERANLYNLDKGKVYKGSVYIPQGDTIYKISRTQKEEYIKLPTDKESYEWINSIEIDDNGNIYALGSNNLFIINNGKVLVKIEVKEILTGIEYDKYVCYDKLLKDNQANIYAVVLFGQNRVLYRINNFNDIKLMDELILSSSTEKSYPVNVFLNEDKEIEAVYEEGYSYKVYSFNSGKAKLDSRFIGEDENVTMQFPYINKMVKSREGLVYILTSSYEYSFFIVDKKNNTIKIADELVNYNRVNTMGIDKKGNVYVGTDYDGLLRLKN